MGLGKQGNVSRRKGGKQTPTVQRASVNHAHLSMKQMVVWLIPASAAMEDKSLLGRSMGWEGCAVVMSHFMESG